MKKWVCTVCGYVHEGETARNFVQYVRYQLRSSNYRKRICHGQLSMNQEQLGVREDIIKDLRANFEGECSEVGMYLAMSRVAFREGYPEVGMYYKQAAYEEADHASRFAELLGECVTASTKKNLELRVAAENGATAGKVDLAKRAKELNLDAIHDTVHEMARDEARHGKAFKGLLDRYFG